MDGHGPEQHIIILLHTPSKSNFAKMFSFMVTKIFYKFRFLL